MLFSASTTDGRALPQKFSNIENSHDVIVLHTHKVLGLFPRTRAYTVTVSTDFGLANWELAQCQKKKLFTGKTKRLVCGAAMAHLYENMYFGSFDASLNEDEDDTVNHVLLLNSLQTDQKTCSTFTENLAAVKRAYAQQTTPDNMRRFVATLDTVQQRQKPARVVPISLT